jgi:hypothetical protein
MTSAIKNLTREGLEKAYKRLQEKLEHYEEHAILEEDINDFIESSEGKTLVDLAEYQRYEELDEENAKLKEDITQHPDFVDIATDWYERHNWMMDKDDFDKLQDENTKLKEQIERERYEHKKALTNQEDKTFLEVIKPLEEDNAKLNKKLQLETKRSNALADACDFYEIDTEFLNDL